MQTRAALSAMLLLGSRAVTSRAVEPEALEVRQDPAPQDPGLQEDGLTITLELSPPADNPDSPPAKRSVTSSSNDLDRYMAFSHAGTLDKRQMVRLINRCPQDGANIPNMFDDFVGSSCNRGANDKDYTIHCDNGAASVPGQGSCGNTEFCVDGVHSDHHPTAAYCVDIGNMVNGVQQIKNANSKGSMQQAIDLFSTGISGLNYIIEAVVSGPSGPGQGYTAGYLSIQGVDGAGKLIPGTLDQCSKCSSIGLEPLPSGFHHAVVQVGLPNPGDVANVYAGIIASGRGF